MKNRFFSILIILAFVTVNGQSYSEMDTLLRHLFNESRYNKLLRPLQNQSHLMKVNFTQYLSSIEHFDISSGELTMTMYFEISWIDDLLTWNPSLFGGKETIPLPRGKFWKPEFAQSNGDADEKSTIGNTGFSQAWVTYQGLVLMVSAGSYKTRCNIDTTIYPFDVHACSFQFVVYNHASTELMLYSPTSDLDIRSLEENGEWEIQYTEAQIVLLKDENIDEIAVAMTDASFSMKRRPLFDCINSYLPIFLLYILSIFTCFVRPDSGERLSFTVTLYLSLGFVTTATLEKIPNNSLRMPLMAYDVLVLNVINTAGVIWSIFIVHLAKIKTIQKRPPAFVVKMVMKKRQGQKSKSKNRIQAEDTSHPAVEVHEYDENDEMRRNDAKREKPVTNVNVNDITGLELADIFDRLYFWVVILIFLIVNFVFLAIILSY